MIARRWIDQPEICLLVVVAREHRGESFVQWGRRSCSTKGMATMKLFFAATTICLPCLLPASAWAEALPPLEVKHGRASNPDWLSINVEPDGEGLYSVALRAATREEEAIAGYDLTLIVDEGEMKGFRTKVAVGRFRPAGSAAAMTLPREIVSGGTLVLYENVVHKLEGRMYRIDLKSYLDQAHVQEDKGGDADADRTAVAREVLRAENEGLESAIEGMKVRACGHSRLLITGPRRWASWPLPRCLSSG